MRFAVNNQLIEVERPPGLPLLDFLRREAGLSGVKYACREGDCGSCAVMVGRPGPNGSRYEIVTSCLMPLGSVAGCHVVTVEGLRSPELNRIQRAFAEHGSSQCGFCTPGFVVSFACHLLDANSWDLDPAVEAVAGNICRCTGYTSIVRAMSEVLRDLAGSVDAGEPRIPALVREDVLPEYFNRSTTLLGGFGVEAAEPSPAPTQTIVGGGTDLYVQRPDDVARGDVFIMRKPAPKTIWREQEKIYLTGTATAEDIKRSEMLAEVVPGADRAMTLMGSLPIRNLATIAGNIVNASPIGDMTIILLALDAEIGLKLGSADRVLQLNDFFLGYKKLDLQPAEVVEWVRFPAPGSPTFLFNFEKVSKRTHLDIASVNTAMSLGMESGTITHAGVSAGGVAPVPMHLSRTSEFLLGREPTADTAIEAAEIARSEVTPISDVRGSARYKALLLRQLILAHFNVLFDTEVGAPVELAK